MIVVKGATDITTYVMMVDSTAGTPETGLTITNIDLQYTRMREAPAAKVDATALAATDSAHADNKAIEINSTSSPGLYRVDWPDAAFATGADKVILCVTCSGCAPAVIQVDLVNYNSQDGVRLGLTALPNAAADAAGGLPISDAGGLDMDAILSRIGTPANLGGGTATLAGNLVDIEAQTDDIGSAGAGLTAVPWNAAWDAEVQSEVQDALVANNLDHLLVAAVDTNFATTVHQDSVIGQIADNGGGFDRTTDSLEAIRDNTGTAGAGLTAADDAVITALAAVDGKIDTIDTNVDSILADTGTDGVVVAAGSKTGYRLSSTGVDDIHDEVVEGTTTLRQSVRLANAALGGKASGLETTTAVYRDIGDSKDRITATVDADGNRSAVTTDLT